MSIGSIKPIKNGLGDKVKPNKGKEDKEDPFKFVIKNKEDYIELDTSKYIVVPRVN